MLAKASDFEEHTNLYIDIWGELERCNLFWGKFMVTLYLGGLNIPRSETSQKFF